MCVQNTSKFGILTKNLITQNRHLVGCIENKRTQLIIINKFLHNTHIHTIY